MKFIHLSDLHIGKTVNGFSMIKDQKYILGKIIEIIEAENADGVLIAGDVYDTSVPSAEAVSLLNEFLSEIKVKTFIISGNHDSAVRLSFGQSIMNKGGVYISPVYDGNIEPIVLEDEFGKIGIYPIPFLKPSVVRDRLEIEAADTEEAMDAVVKGLDVPQSRRNIALVHQFLTGAEKGGSEEMSIGAVENISAAIFDAFDYVALGHIHRSQKVLRETVRYSGSPLKYSFSEIAHEKSVTVVELKEKGNVNVKKIPLVPLHDMREVVGTYDEITLRKNYENTNTEDYIRIVLEDEDEIPNALDRLRGIYPNIMELRYKKSMNEEISRLEPMSELPSPKTVFGEFYEGINGLPMSKDQEKLLDEIIREVWEEEE